MPRHRVDLIVDTDQTEDEFAVFMEDLTHREFGEDVVDLSVYEITVL